MWNDKLQTSDYLEDLNFQKLYGSDVRLDLGNASEFHKLIRVDVLGELLSRHMFCNQHDELIYGGAKNLLRYLRGTISRGLGYTAGSMKLHDYSNANWAGSVEDLKSTSKC